ncbi:palmitoyl-(protein) hydrolase [Aureococcus anophagefferens]|uniref:Palmitoyl-(Protein) hydrolase n=1 Tax=Aureococcus anophagefferens TaxID=44056 RepID=A0ABR1FGR4_AURAN
MGLGSSSESGERPAGAAPVDDDEAGPSSYWDMASNGYQELVNAIIRPPRAEYDMDDLGPASFEWHGHAFQRVDLELLAEELVQKARDHGLSVPGFVVSIALRMVRSSVLKTADFKLEDVSPIKHADSCFVPALFVAGERDDFIDPAHSRALHGKYAGDKNLRAIFLSNYMGVPPAAAIPGADAFNGGYPPWIPSDHYGLNLADLGFSDLDLDQQNLGMTRDRQAEVQDTISNASAAGPAAAVRGRAAAPRRRARRRPAGARRASAPPGRQRQRPGQRRRRRRRRAARRRLGEDAAVGARRAALVAFDCVL